MSGEREEPAEQQQRVLNIVSTAVSVVAVAFLGGGFYYGMTKQKKALAEEEKSLGKPSKSKREFKPKAATLFEKKLALDRPLPPGTAAFKALLGVTLVSVTGCCILVGGAAAALGVGNMTELRERLKTPQSKKQVTSKHFDFEGLGEVKREILDVIADEVKDEAVKEAGDK